MSNFVVKHQRPDGSFVVDLHGLPYHVTGDDPLFAAVAEVAADLELSEEVPIRELPAAPAQRVVTSLAFLERFTPEERIAIRRAARLDEGLEDWLDMLRAAQEVDLDDPRTIAGMHAMVGAGLLSAERAVLLLG